MSAHGLPDRPALPGPLTIVGGFDELAKAEAVRAAFQARPPAERWALIVDQQAWRPDAVPAGIASDHVFALPGGCACCMPPAAWAVLLRRLCGAGRPDRLLMTMSSHGEVTALRSVLRRIAGAPAIEAVYAVVDARRPGPWLDDPLPNRARALLESADAVLLHHPDAAAPDGLPEVSGQPGACRLLSVLAGGPGPVLRRCWPAHRPLESGPDAAI